MSDPIVNRVASSGLITLDLEEILSFPTIKELDIAPILFQGMILKEEDLREFTRSHDWSQYKGSVLGIFCSIDAIIPQWAYMLLVSKASAECLFVTQGDVIDARRAWVQSQLSRFDVDEFKDARVVIKGCGDEDVIPLAYSELTRMLVPHVKSLMFGEPCSTVPVYKRKS